jgi:potassium/hydrogen antiporter
MFFIDQILFFGAVLLLFGILSQKFSARFGIPALVLFILVGMIAGEEGLGGIAFDSYEIAHGAGTLALAVILFDGGLRTPASTLSRAWKPALTLATVGVLLTSVTIGLFAAWILGLPIIYGLLLGSIVGSTDAAAVFSVLKSAGFKLEERLESTLEVESGSNDPMAIFLTLGMIEIVLGERSPGIGMIQLLLLQLGVGSLAGILLGKTAALIINRINLNAAGLYPVLVLTLGLAIYGVTTFVGGSGFLAIYIAGIVIGNSRLVFKRGTFLFHDGIAYVAQIAMFVVLGLLSFPSELLLVTWHGLAIAGGLVFVARPIAVVLSLLPFRFSWRELVLVSWGGLKGAVPIILATYPLLFGVANGVLMFNVVFFVVLVSALLQGWTLPVAARWLKLDKPTEKSPPVSLDITSLRHVDADIVSYEISEETPAAHLRISELGLPEDAVVALVSRGRDLIPARGPTVLLPGDHVFLVVKQDVRLDIDRVFSAVEEAKPSMPLRAGIYVPRTLSLRELDVLYGIVLQDGGDTETIGTYMARKLGRPLTEGAFLEAHDLRFFVPRRPDGRVDRIGIEVVD